MFDGRGSKVHSSQLRLILDKPRVARGRPLLVNFSKDKGGWSDGSWLGALEDRSALVSRFLVGQSTDSSLANSSVFVCLLLLRSALRALSLLEAASSC